MKNIKIKNIIKHIEKYSEHCIRYSTENNYIILHKYFYLSLHIDLNNLRIKQGLFTKIYTDFPDIKELIKYIKNHFNIKKFDNIKILHTNKVLYLQNKKKS